LDKYKEKCLNKGMLENSDLKGTLVYLLSDMSKYVNGQNIIVDDGFSL
jgi:enoyl-[acyl-carrier-protein] reductase (NADH)